MNEQGKFVGLFQYGTDAINKIKGMRSVGWVDENMYLLLWERGDFTILRYRHKPDKKLADGTWEDYFQGFMSGERHVKKAMNLLGVHDLDPENYYEKIENGAYLLYADRGELANYYMENSEFRSAAPQTMSEAGETHMIDATPGVTHDERGHYPRRGHRRVAMDGQNIRREGDRIIDPNAETGFDSEYYKLGQDTEYHEHQ